MTGAVAISLMPLETRREVLLRIATGADRLGYAGFFLPETWAHDTTVLLAEAAVRTERTRLGTGILGVWGRSAAQLAMAAATLHDVSGGRFTLGLGASTAQLAEGLHDAPRGGARAPGALAGGRRRPAHPAAGAQPHAGAGRPRTRDVRARALTAPRPARPASSPPPA